MDVDGVLIAEAARRDDEEPPWPGGFVTAYPYTDAQVAPAMVQALNALIAKEHIVGYWVTSWGYEAPTFGESIGLRGSLEWPVLEAGTPTWGTWNKAAVVREHVRETGPDAAVWIDDQLRQQHRAKAWALHAGVQPITPSPVYGITPRELQVVERYIEGRLARPGR
ncbi:hypothetical protein [Sinomonas atrocyanea]|uniref:hypothetical protein n=1 Tax=Sinomonas atrocyanea TaxID=37927 RepID=UPI0027D792A7|nr:hypothetical protein [Sinomonas atrocyanea]